MFAKILEFLKMLWANPYVKGFCVLIIDWLYHRVKKEDKKEAEVTVKPNTEKDPAYTVGTDDKTESVPKEVENEPLKTDVIVEKTRQARQKKVKKVTLEKPIKTNNNKKRVVMTKKK